MANSKAEKVHEFALKVFRANTAFANLVQIEDTISFLKSPFEETAKLGFNLAKEKYDRNNPQKGLVIAMLESHHQEAVSTAHQWISEQKEVFLQDVAFVTSLVLSENENTRLWTREWLSLHATDASIGESILAKTLSLLLSTKQLVADEVFVSSVIDTLLAVFPAWIRKIHLDTLLSFITHPNLVVQLAGAKLLVKNQVGAEQIPEQILLSLIRSEKDSVRAVGLELIGRLPVEKLVDKKNLLISLLLSPLGDLRNNVRPVLGKIVQYDPEFAKELIELLVPSLLMPESYEGLHQDIVAFFTGADILPHLAYLSKTKVLALSRSRNKSAQILGLALFKQNIPTEELTVEELVKLASNAQLEAREYTWQLFNKFAEKIKQEKEEAIKITDSYWVDTRIFAFAYFKEKFDIHDWTPNLFVGLCDSVKEDVQAYGREMITKCFESSQGEFYLQSLSQHPDTKMQLFASNYLESFASGKPQLITGLTLFFQTLLSQVNKGRTAKTRALAFLRKESLQSKEVAMLTAQILNRISASISIQDKAKCISILLELRKKYPELEVLVKVNPIPNYIKQD